MFEHEPIRRTRMLMSQGDLAAADMTAAQALAQASDPTRAELLYLRGTIANRRRDNGAAVAFLQQALEQAPRMGMAWLALGHARMQAGALPDALQAYARAAECEPGAADTWFNLGVVHHRLAQACAAARAFHHAWTRDPRLDQAAKACMQDLAACVRGGAHPALLTPSLPAQPSRVSTIVCSRDDAKAAHAAGLFARVLAQVPHQYIAIRDARSLAEAYNRGLDAATGDIVLLSHDDVDVLVDDFAARLIDHLQHCDALGVIGATRMTGPLPIWAGHPHLRGWITHHAPGSTTWEFDVLHPQPLAHGIVVLDGVLLAARRTVFDTIRFDAGTFDGFHGYDVDWSWRAAQAGFTMAAAGDLGLVHASRGRYDATWERYAARFCAKHGTGREPPAPPPFYEVALTSEAQAQALHASLLALAREDECGDGAAPRHT